MAKIQTEAGEVRPGERIAKRMARAGLCSRRDAERMISAGRVSLNGKIIDSPAVNVGPKDKVAVDGKALAAADETRLWLYHKPRGIVTTHKDTAGRKTVFASLPEDLGRVISIGRLDLNSEGLLLLTNDGELARKLELPETGWIRKYRVRARGSVEQDTLDGLKKGVVLDGIRYGPITARLDRIQGANLWLTIGLREGKNKEVRKVLASLGLSVSRLIRISFGPFRLGDLSPGALSEVRRKMLREQLGNKLSAGNSSPGRK